MTNIPSPSQPVKVLLVDDHPVFREGLRSVIDHLDGILVCAEADDECSAIKLLEMAPPPDMVIVDLNLGNGSGLRLIQRARKASADLRILVASMYEEAMYGGRAIAAGANGYVCKQDDPELLEKAITQVSSGKMFISPGLAAHIRERRDKDDTPESNEPADLLSERELQVFGLIGNGYSTKEIAARLHLSPKTVESHRDHVKQKIGVTDNTRLVYRAVEWVLSQ